jgi:hypothetical protein
LSEFTTFKVSVSESFPCSLLLTSARLSELCGPLCLEGVRVRVWVCGRMAEVGAWICVKQKKPCSYTNTHTHPHFVTFLLVIFNRYRWFQLVSNDFWWLSEVSNHFKSFLIFWTPCSDF